MKVSFASSYLSIVEFPDTLLGSFSIITGENGAGKTHFLQALRDGNLVCDIAPSPHLDIRYFEWQSFVPYDSGGFSSDNYRNEIDNLSNQYEGRKRSHDIIEAITSAARSNGLPAHIIANFDGLLNIDRGKINSLIEDGDRAQVCFDEISKAREMVSAYLLSGFDQNTQVTIRTIAEKSKKSIIGLTRDDIRKNMVPIWGQSNIFQQSFGRLFGAYRDTKLKNDILAFRKSRNLTNRDALSDDEFIERYGPPPWDFVNEVLKNSGLDFYINKPDDDDFTNFTPQLFSTRSNVPIGFSSLSSGEKVLLSFAFCTYYASDQRQLTTYPKLILLDEIDAPLHPSMSKTVIETICNVLVKQFSLHVIAATHSPSTVAVSPEESIYAMYKLDSGLKKISKAQALNILTYGVPTISVSYDGRRQVFVESPADARIYEDLYKILKRSINAERSLQFIATGIKSKEKHDVNTGSGIVKHLVEELVAAGNISVFGVIDWDGENNPQDRIEVLAHGRRNGLENVLLDPLLLAALICRDCHKYKNEIGVPDETGFIEFCHYGKDRLQEVVVKVAEKVLKSAAVEVCSCDYVGGFSLKIDKKFLELDDHLLERMVIDAFPSMQNISKQKQGKLMLHMINSVLTDKKEFMPMEIKDLFVSLLHRDAY